MTDRGPIGRHATPRPADQNATRNEQRADDGQTSPGGSRAARGRPHDSAASPPHDLPKTGPAGEATSTEPTGVLAVRFFGQSGEGPSEAVVRALHDLGTPNLGDHERLVGETEAERRCVEAEAEREDAGSEDNREVRQAMFVGWDCNGDLCRWPSWCGRHTHQTEHCRDYWAKKWFKRAGLAFGECDEVQVLIADPRSMDALHRSIRNQPANPRLFRLTLRLGGVVVILTNGLLKPASRGVLGQSIVRGSDAPEIVSAVLNAFHLDGRDKAGSGRGEASEPVLTSSKFPEVPANRPMLGTQRFDSPVQADRYSSAIRRALAEVRIQYPDLPTAIHSLQRDHPEIVKQVTNEALAEALDSPGERC